MKKVLFLFMTLVLTLSMTLTASAASDKSKGHEKSSAKSTSESQKSATQKQFKLELNEQKKTVAQEKSKLEADRLVLEAQYQEYLAAGLTAEAEGVLASIDELDAQAAELQAQMKQIINERYMVTKTMYSEEELQQFESAGALIEQMYADVELLDLGSMTVNNNLIKLEAPIYIKGGKTLIPIRTITEELGAEVTWDEEAKSVTISKDGTVVVFTINSTTVSVTSQPVVTETDPPAAETDPLVPPAPVTITTEIAPEVTCGRTYVPLRFLSETFGLEVTYDEETEGIDIDDGTSDGTVGDTTGDTPII